MLTAGSLRAPEECNVELYQRHIEYRMSELLILRRGIELCFKRRSHDDASLEPFPFRYLITSQVAVVPGYLSYDAI